MPVSTSASRTLAAIAIEVDRARTEVWALVDGRVVGEVFRCIGVGDDVADERGARRSLTSGSPHSSANASIR